MNNLPRQKLCEIVAIYGDSLYEDDRRTEGLLRDFCGEYKREIHVLVSAVKEKVPTSLLSSQHSLPVEILLPRLRKRLVENRAIAEPAAQWAVESWALALGIISEADCTVISSNDPAHAGADKTTSEAIPRSPAVPLASLDASSLVSEPSPYTLQPGLSIASFEELPDACEQAWERAVDHFVRGYFTEWLERWLVPLRAKGRYDYVGSLETLLREVRSTQAEVAQGDAIVRSAALEDFLQAIGRIAGKPNAPQLDLIENQIDLGVVAKGDVALGRFTLTNATRGFLHGRIVSNAPGLLVEPSRFGCRCGEEVEIEIRRDTADLEGSPQGMVHPAEMSIISNGGRKNVTAQVEVGIPALDVQPTTLDFGRVVVGNSSRLTIQITNSGIGELAGRLVSNDAWLKLGKADFHCTSGETRRRKIAVDTSSLTPGSYQADLKIGSNVGTKVITCEVVVVPVPELQVSPEQLYFDVTSIQQSVKLGNVGGGTLHTQLRTLAPWLTVDADILELDENRSADVTVKVDFGLLGSVTRESAMLATVEGVEEKVKVTANGQRLPPARSRLGWEVKCPNGSTIHVQSEVKLRELIAEGCWINNNLPRRPIDDFTPNERLCGVVKEVKLVGAIVDVGALVDGLLHISELGQKGVTRTSDVLSEGQTITAWVKQLDLEKGRLNLTMQEPPKYTWADLKPGLKLEGKVVRLEKFGAFVDIGAGTDGLVHVSEMSKGRVESPAHVVSEGDVITLWIKEADRKSRRISLTMLEPPEVDIRTLKPDTVLMGKVVRIEDFGAFVDIGAGRDGMVHVTEMRRGYVGSPSEIVSVGDEIEVRVLEVDPHRGRISLSIEDLTPETFSLDEGEEAIPSSMEIAVRQAMKQPGVSFPSKKSR